MGQGPVDILIIGGGVSGGVVAKRLAEAGLSVLCLEQGGVYHLWGHSWEVDARGDWGRLERVLGYIAGRPQVAYVANHDVIEVA